MLWPPPVYRTKVSSLLPEGETVTWTLRVSTVRRRRLGAVTPGDPVLANVRRVAIDSSPLFDPTTGAPARRAMRPEQCARLRQDTGGRGGGERRRRRGQPRRAHSRKDHVNA